jgi:hypothetical protein
MSREGAVRALDARGAPGGEAAPRADALESFSRSRAATSVAATREGVTEVPLVVGVTSHRNLVTAEIDALRARVRGFFEHLQRDRPELPLVVLSSLAEGGDQLVAREALACGAKLVAPLPLPVPDYAEDFASPELRAGFIDLCGEAEVLELPLLGGGIHGDARDRQYAQAGVFVASHSHLLLALWDGRESPYLGGTAQVVRYALEGVMPGLVEARTGGHAGLGAVDESLVLHIACSRAEADDHVSPPLPPLAPGQARWVSQSGATDADGPMPSSFRRIFARMQALARDKANHSDKVRAAAAIAPDPHPGDEVLDGLLCLADTLAMHFQKRVLFTLRGLHVLAALTGIAFLVYSELPAGSASQYWAIYGFFALFGAGAVLAALARRRDWHRKYVDYRALAEGLRVQRAWRRAGVQATGPSAFAHDSFLQKHDVELGWIRNVMRAASIDGADDPPVPDAMLEAAIDEWIGAPGGSGQLAYYARKADERGRTFRGAQALVRACLWIGLAIAAALALFQDRFGAGNTHWLVVAMGVLALVAAARESYAYRKGDKELHKQYRHMRGLFADARARLDAAPGATARREILRALGEAALAEHSEWALLHRERPLENTRF